jgi:signal transduction histidine kinase
MHFDFGIFQRRSWWTGRAGWLVGAWLLRTIFAQGRAMANPEAQPARLQQRVARLAAELAEARQALQQSAQAQRQILSRAEQAREEERLHIARELHDELGGALTCLKLEASRLLRREPLPGDTRLGLISLNENIDLAIELMRSVATELRPTLLEQIGLGAALQTQFEAFLDRTGLDGEFLRSTEDVALTGEPAIACYRIFQEALTNIARHAQATWISARLETVDGQVILTVSDNGRGIRRETDMRRGALGLAGMGERASLVDADLQITSAPGQGTTVRLAIPQAYPAPFVPAAAMPVTTSALN